MFIPTTSRELKTLGWDKLDVILVSGDAYLDFPACGCALIGHVLIEAGYRVGIIALPDTQSGQDISRLGEPLLFWGLSSGSVDSMVANYTASGKKRQQDDLTPGGQNNRRPDRALLVYANLIRRHFKKTVPLVLGGLEASLRRIAHYDFWSNTIRRSVLFDAKADILLYGMAERAVLELAAVLKARQDYRHLRGLCYAASTEQDGFIKLPDFTAVSTNKHFMTEAFRLFYENCDPLSGRGLCQKQTDRYLIHNPPAAPLTPSELDKIYELPFERQAHPFYLRQGSIRALDTISNSVTTHRGCCGECNFCAITVHQGRQIISRSAASILKEIRELACQKGFNGIIRDLGGPTANMYGMDCPTAQSQGNCSTRHCLTPAVCSSGRFSHKRLINLYAQARRIPGVKKIFIASGIRYDIILADGVYGQPYLEALVEHHISGQLKVAPEHCQAQVLKLMNKQKIDDLVRFKKLFDFLNKKQGKKQFLTYYFIAAHPGCTHQHMLNLRDFVHKNLHLRPQQVQIFTPTPSTWSTLMYYTETDPFSGQSLFVEKEPGKKNRQKGVLTNDTKTNR